MEEYDVESILDMYESDYVPEPSAMAQGGRIPFDNGGEAVRLKALQADYDKFGKEKLNKAAKTLGFKDYASMSGQENNNFRRKIKNELTKYDEVLPRYEADVRGRGTRILKEQAIQIKLLEETNKKKFFDPKKFAKENKISMDTLKKQAALLQKNIYNKRMKMVGKDMRFQLDWIPDNPSASDNALNKLWKSKLIKYDKNKIDELFYQAFGNSKSPTYNPKKFLAIKKNLNEYRQLRDAINARFPNINFELDHPLSKSSLNKLFNATTDQLTRVNVLESDLNNGFKDSLSLQYEKAVQGNNLNKKKAVEKIAKDLNLNIGKISDNATNFKYGVKEFQKLNIKDEIGKSLQNLNTLNKNFQTYAKNNPDLFKTANVSTEQIFTKIKPSELKKIQKFLDTGDGVTLGANRISKKLLTKTLGDMAISLGSPTALLGLNAYLGVDPRESLDRAILGGEVALAPSGIKALTSRLDNIKNPLVRKSIETAAGLRLPGVFTPANVMRAARFASPVGIATLAGEGLYQFGKLGYEEQQRINAMSPEEKAEYLAEQQELADMSA